MACLRFLSRASLFSIFPPQPPFSSIFSPPLLSPIFYTLRRVILQRSSLSDRSAGKLLFPTRADSPAASRELFSFSARATSFSREILLYLPSRTIFDALPVEHGALRIFCTERFNRKRSDESAVRGNIRLSESGKFAVFQRFFYFLFLALKLIFLINR